MIDPLREPDFLTAHQLRAVHPERDIFLTACPGSGKTRAAGVRIARIDDDGRRVAGCSYTNVGVEQLRRVINVDLGYTLHSRQFLGTLHTFLLRYVLYPFGHLVTGGRTPRVLDEHAHWREVVFDDANKVRLGINYFQYHPDGTLCVRTTPTRFSLSREEAVAQGSARARELKIQALRAGMVSFDDAMFLALTILRRRPGIAAAVAARFDEILVDEAQDTSELQLACLTEICKTGELDSLVLVGDLEQSISAYTGASRTGCEALAQLRGLTHVPFEENHRSSQRICDVAFRFCAREASDRAVGPDRECEWAPEILLYSRNDPRGVLDRFRERLDALEHPHDEAAVLARWNKLVDELNGTTTSVDILHRPLAVARAVSALRGADTLGRRDIEAVDRIIAYCAEDLTDLAELQPHERWAYRAATMELLRRAPSLDEDLRAWIQQTAAILGELVGRFTDTPGHHAGRILLSNKKQEGHVTRDVVRTRAQGSRAQTVHDIKGESRGAVLVVVDPKSPAGVRPRTRCGASTCGARLSLRSTPRSCGSRSSL